MKTKLIALAVLLIAIASCSSNKTTCQVTSNDIDSAKWVMIDFADGSELEIVKCADVILEFDSLSVAGSAGCNSFIANYSLKDSKIKISNMGVTKMACDDEKAKFEELYLKALSEELEVELSTEGNGLILKNRDKGIKIKYNKAN